MRAGILALHGLLTLAVLYWLHRHGLFVDGFVQQWFYSPHPNMSDPRAGWLINKNNVQATFLLHTLVRYGFIAFGVFVLACLIASAWIEHLHANRWALAILFATLVLAFSSVAFLKNVTGHYCPAHIAYYGGPVEAPLPPFMAPDGPPFVYSGAGPQPRCFPAAHPSSGFALMAFAFFARTRKGFMYGITFGIMAGLLLGFVQLARGEHYLSHVVATGLLVGWIMHTIAFVISPAPRLRG